MPDCPVPALTISVMNTSKKRKRSFNEKLRIVAVCLLLTAAINFALLHHLQDALLLHDEDQSFLAFSQELRANPTRYSSDENILPKKLITVIGKESSGTTFVAKTIAASLNLPGQQKYRDGFFHHERRRDDGNQIQVQHVSLPHGGWCMQNHSHHIVDVILPAQCIQDKFHNYPGQMNPSIWEQCQQFLNSTNLQLYEGKAEVFEPSFMNDKSINQSYYGSVRYPGRVFAHSALVRSHNVTRTRNGRRINDRDQGKGAGRREDRHSDESASEEQPNIHNKYHEDPEAKKKVDANRRLRQENQQRKREMVKREVKERQQVTRRVTLRGNKQQLIEQWLANVNKIPLDELRELNLVKYPPRYLLNITTQKIWYDAHGTEQVIVIVVRDEAMSFQSRLKSGHCQVVELAKEEEGIATAILNDAIKTFFLDDKSGYRSGFDGRWTAKTVHGIIQEASIWDPGLMIENKTDPSDLLHSSLIPARNNVILISYEAMMKYEQDFVQELYKVLGIESQFQPEFKDGNAKYRKGHKRGGGMDKGDMDKGDMDKGDMEENENSRHVLKLEFDGASLLLPASMWLVVAICFFGAGCVLGFWVLLCRYLFGLTYVDPNSVGSRRRR
jgi:hypothetical protein